MLVTRTFFGLILLCGIIVRLSAQGGPPASSQATVPAPASGWPAPGAPVETVTAERTPAAEPARLPPQIKPALQTFVLAPLNAANHREPSAERLSPETRSTAEMPQFSAGNVQDPSQQHWQPTHRWAGGEDRNNSPQMAELWQGRIEQARNAAARRSQSLKGSADPFARINRFVLHRNAADQPPVDSSSSFPQS